MFVYSCCTCVKLRRKSGGKPEVDGGCVVCPEMGEKILEGERRGNTGCEEFIS